MDQLYILQLQISYNVYRVAQ